MSEISHLATTPLYALHQALGAKLVPFAGYHMPVQYSAGVLKEHLHTRSEAGLFDVSHMGQLRLSGEGVREALEALIPVDIIGLPIASQRYGFLTLDNGGILDDLMITNCGDYLLLVINAACKETDIAHLRQHLPSTVCLDVLEDKALLALQGPKARQVMGRLNPEVAKLTFMKTAEFAINDIHCFVSCSGYTGEDGFEISVPADKAEALATLLLAEPEVAPIGLGARDSLRLEAGLCLYGHDIDQDTSPVMANLLWAIQKIRRPGGERSGGYLGADVLAQQLAEGVQSKRVVLKPVGRAPVREGASLVDEDGSVMGRVTSGGFGPTVGGPIAMGYVDVALLNAGKPLFAQVRNKLLPVDVITTGLLPSRYFRS